MNNYLAVTWSTSRGRDTYGYNICRLDDHRAGKRYRCIGGGYDMVGTVLGQWLQDQHQARLQLLKFTSPSGEPALVDCNYSAPGWTKREDLYGLTFSPKGKASLDGACGIESMLRIAEACGLNITRDYSRRRGGSVGFFVS